MRLVDAALPTPIEDEYKHVHKLIDAQPTVEAIPVEFIKERMTGFYDNGYTELGACLEALLMDWGERREHETD